MTCSAASTLQSLSKIPLPSVPGLSAAQNQALKRWGQQVLSQIQGAAGVTGVNVIPQQYALVAGSTLPPIFGTSNCSVALDAATSLFGAGSYKVTITGTPATVTFSADTAWPLHPGWQWLVSFFQRASAAIAGQITITTPTKAYTTDFTTTLTASGWQRLFDALNLGADTSTSFGLSVTFTGGTGQTVWLDGLMLEPYFNVAMAPSPFISTSSPLTIDNNPDGPNYVKLLGTHASGNVAFNYKGVWSSATSYVIGDEVVYGQNYWICIAANTNSAPPSADWQVVGSYAAFLGAWNAITTYAIGAEVTYNGNFWIAVAQNSNSAPTTSNANWQIAGPTSLDNISDGPTFQRTQQYAFGNNTNSQQWMHVGTLVLNPASSATFYWSSGAGYNTGSNQQSIAAVTIRASNNVSGAPNLAGIMAWVEGNTSGGPFYTTAGNCIALVATGQSTSQANTSWEVYFYCQGFTYGPLQVVVNRGFGDSFVFSGAAGAPNTTVSGSYLEATAILRSDNTGAVVTSGIGSNAASQIGSAVNAAGGSLSESVSHGGDLDMVSITLTTNGYPVGVDVSSHVTIVASTGVTSSGFIEVYRDGAAIGTIAFNITNAMNGQLFWSGQVTLTADDAPAAGSHTYTMHIHLGAVGSSGSVTASWDNVGIKVREYKR